MSLKTAERVLEKWLPRIADFVRTHITPRLKSLVQDDKKLERILKLTYRFMPFPARLIVSKEKFVSFIMTNKNRIFPKGPVIATEAELA